MIKQRLDHILALDYTYSPNYEKLLKLFQYGLRFLNISLKNNPIKMLFKNISTVRRILRLFKQLNAVNGFLRVKRNYKFLSDKVFKYLSYICFFIFINMDLIILFYKLKYLRNKKVLFQIFEFVDLLWLFQNFCYIMDDLVSIKDLLNQKPKSPENGKDPVSPKELKKQRQEKINGILMHIMKVSIDSGLASSFYFHGLGERFTCFNGFFSGLVGLFISRA